MLAPGDPTPGVAAPNQHGERVVPDFDEPTVLYFYPEDGTPGCSTEAAQFVAEREVYEDAGVTVYGVSTDGVDAHAAFADAEDVHYDLLADPDGELAAAFGVPTPEGRAERTTFVLDDGQVVAVYESVDPDGHARDVMMDLLDDGAVELAGF
jgi:peroxiredoxin Q/BCP